MQENLSLAFQGVWNHKLRSFLTMLGIIIGIASIITIVSTIRGTSEQIKANLVGSGTNAVVVQLYQDDYPCDLQYSAPPAGVLPISGETREELLELDHVENVSLYSARNWCDGVYAGDTAYTGALSGVDEHYFDVCGYALSYGRLFLPEDFRDFRKVVILDGPACTNLFAGAYPIGQTVEILGETYTVIGVVEQKKPELEIKTINDYYTYNQSTGGTLFIPLSTWPILYRFDEPQSVVLRARNTDDMTQVGQEAANLLTATQIRDSSGTYSYRSQDLMEQAEKLQELSNSTNRQLLWIASISLLVGGIGVMNIMLVTVTERTREIGLKKAIGARRKFILAQFLTEAAVLTSVGGLLGVIAGIVMARLISAVMGTPTAVSPGATLIALLFSTVIGVLFGLLPAIKAANLNPIEALRRE
ncbi:MAG: ABC transporter permease [Oscillospiraceae bacterium]|nr:ABC transporter permease [Oscillospiraceae bacterium]